MSNPKKDQTLALIAQLDSALEAGKSQRVWQYILKQVKAGKIKRARMLLGRMSHPTAKRMLKRLDEYEAQNGGSFQPPARAGGKSTRSVPSKTERKRINSLQVAGIVAVLLIVGASVFFMMSNNTLSGAPNSVRGDILVASYSPLPNQITCEYLAVQPITASFPASWDVICEEDLFPADGADCSFCDGTSRIELSTGAPLDVNGWLDVVPVNTCVPGTEPDGCVELYTTGTFFTDWTAPDPDEEAFQVVYESTIEAGSIRGVIPADTEASSGQMIITLHTDTHIVVLRVVGFFEIDEMYDELLDGLPYELVMQSARLLPAIAIDTHPPCYSERDNAPTFALRSPPTEDISLACNPVSVTLEYHNNRELTSMSPEDVFRFDETDYTTAVLGVSRRGFDMLWAQDSSDSWFLSMTAYESTSPIEEDLDAIVGYFEDPDAPESQQFYSTVFPFGMIGPMTFQRWTPPSAISDAEGVYSIVEDVNTQIVAINRYIASSEREGWGITASIYTRPENIETALIEALPIIDSIEITDRPTTFMQAGEDRITWSYLDRRIEIENENAMIIALIGDHPAEIPQTRTEDGAYLIGNPDAPMTMVVFTDYLCPQCVSFQPTFQELVDTAVTNGDINIEIRMVPAVDETQSILAFELAECGASASEEITFWQAQGAVYNLTRSNTFDELVVNTFAEQFSLEPSSIDRCLDGRNAQWRVDRNVAIEAGITSVPTIAFHSDDEGLVMPFEVLPTIEQIERYIAGSDV